MRALSLTQPWGSLVAIGAKRIETRSWPTSYRGPLAIHAAKAYPVAAQAFFHDTIAGDLLRQQHINQPPRGVVVAVCQLVACVRTPDRDGLWFDFEIGSGRVRMPPPEPEVLFGDYSPGRYAWLLADIVALPDPIAARGSRMFWEWDAPAHVQALLASGGATA